MPVHTGHSQGDSAPRCKLVYGEPGVIDILYTYVIIFSYWYILLQELLEKMPEVSLALRILAGGHIVPTALAMMVLARWFKGTVVAVRAANQRALLRSLLATLIAWGLAISVGLLWQEWLSDPRWARVLSHWTGRHNAPFPNLAAAAGIALGAASWRRTWRWSLGCLLATGLWAGAQVCLGFYYPMDIVVGLLIGAIVGWLLGSMIWLDRLMGVFVRLARRWMLA